MDNDLIGGIVTFLLGLWFTLRHKKIAQDAAYTVGRQVIYKFEPIVFLVFGISFIVLGILIALGVI